ncbi:MAG TPA: DUF4157 domain-containing protein [Longimicrobiales bacterium]
MSRRAGAVAVQGPTAKRPPGPTLRRCPCGGIAGPDGECEACRRKRLAAEARARQPGDAAARETARAAGVARAPASAAHPATGASPRAGGPAPATPATGHSFASMPIRPATAPRLEVGRPDDRYERDAREFSERVLTMAAPQPPMEPSPQPPTGPSARPRPQPQAASGATMPVADPRTAEWIRSGRGGGAPLDGAQRAFFEPRFGYDFRDVRIHTDAAAGAAALGLGARAFTFGRDIAFAPGEYEPGTREGRKLLAHELTHVVQQVPHIARDDGDDGDAPCTTGRTEGSGQVSNYHGRRIYVIWGTFRAGDTPRSYWERVIPRWIQWRFGNVGAGTRDRMLRILNPARFQVLLRSPQPNCQYGTALDLSVVRQLTRIAGQAAAAEEAEAREAGAGLPPPPPPSPTPRPIGEVPPEAGAATPESGQTTPPEGEAERDAPRPVPRLGSEFEGGTGPRATHPALPARIEGPDFGVAHGIGTYTMRLEYWPAGLDLLSQVVEAMNWVDYHWELYDVTALVREGLSREQIQREHRHDAVSEEAEVGRMAATARRAEHAVEDLASDAERAVEGLANPVEAAHGGSAADVILRAQANFTSLELLPASAIVSAGGVALGALADLVGGEFQEREIPWPDREGFVMIRCIAQPSPQGPNGEIRRAASVATKIVEIQSATRRARGVLDEPEAEIAELELRLALTRDPEQRRRLEQEIADRRIAATADPLRVIEHALERKRAERDRTTNPYQRRQLDREIEVLEQRLQLAREQRAEFAAGPVYRPRAVLVSQVTGETYPLLLQLAALPMEGTRYRYRVADVTTPDGESWDGGGATPDEAVWNAFREMATHNGYGRGRIAIRLPADAPFRPTEDVLASAPADVDLARQRLNDLATILVALGLFVPGVGEVAAVLGAALAADRLLERWRNHTLRFDAAAVSDLIGLLGAAAQGAQVIGRLRVIQAEGRFFMVAANGDEAAIRSAAAALRSARTAEQAAEVAGQIANYGGVLWGDLVTLDQILEINQQELRGAISHAEARRRRAQLLTAAVRDNVLSFAPSPAAEGAPGRPPAATEPGPAPAETAGPRAGEPPVAGRPPEPRPAGRPPEGSERAPAAGRGAPERASEPARREQIDESELRPRAQPPEQAGRPRSGERVRARATTPDGLHHIIVLADGRIFRCSRNCGELRSQFGSFLGPQSDPARQPEANRLDAELAALERRAAAAATEAEAMAVAVDTALLEPQIRRFAAEALSPELGGIHPDRLEKLLEAFGPDEVRRLRDDLGHDNLNHLGNRSEGFIREFARVWELTQGDAAARVEIVHTVELTRGGHPPAEVEVAFRELAQFLEQYPGRVSGAMVSRFHRAFSRRGRPADARAEIALARDILEGQTPLGPDLALEGIPESSIPHVRTPEFRVRAPDGTTYLVEAKRVGEEGGQVNPGGFRRSLGSAIGQIVQEARRSGDVAGFIRLDSRHTSGTSLSVSEMVASVNGELHVRRSARDAPGTTVRGADYVRWVEILYNEGGQPRRLLLEVRDGSVVVVSGGENP